MNKNKNQDNDPEDLNIYADISCKTILKVLSDADDTSFNYLGRIA